MNQKVVIGLTKVMEDKKLNKEFTESKTPQEAYEIAKPYLDGASFEEFKDTVKSISSSKENLTLDDLDNVSGGVSFKEGAKKLWGWIKPYAKAGANYANNWFQKL